MYHEAVYINTNSAFPDAFGAVSYWFVIQQNQTKPALSQSSSRPFLDLLSQSPKTIGFSRHPYEPIEGVERLEIYCVGGYHPINIGDHIHTRYQVVQKLGHGAFSTIWLARDQRHGKYVAIKGAPRVPTHLNLASFRNFPTRNKAQVQAWERQ
jgi:hypothetical protein